MSKISLLLVGALSAGALASAAAAQTPEGTVVSDHAGVVHTTTLFKTGKNLETVTCAQFNALDESFKPQAVSIAANYGPHGHAHPTETVSGVERVTPEVLTACRARPGDHLLAHVHSAMMRK